MKKLQNTLYVTTQGAYLAKEGESVIVRVEQETRLRVPIHSIGGIVCFGQVSCSPFLTLPPAGHAPGPPPARRPGRLSALCMEVGPVSERDPKGPKKKEPEKMMVLVSYDVSTVDKAGRSRLRRIAKKCLDYGVRVQNSVFECDVDPAQWAKLKHELEEIIEEEQDSLRNGLRCNRRPPRGGVD